MFKTRLNELIQKKKSLLCVGLDTDLEKIPNFLLGEVDPLYIFNKAIIEATHDYAVAFKLNLAFYESLGLPGWELLERTLEEIPKDVLIIADAKRGDIENTGKKYAEAFFKTYPFDAVTVSPYMGMDSVVPFLEYEHKGVFILCLTSNAGSMDFQFLKVENEPLYLKVARKALEWNFLYGNCGLVVGGTHPQETKEVRDLAPGLPFLVPGVGSQGGNLEQVIKYATDEKGQSTLINASRTILYASSERDFAEAARVQAKHLRDQINMFVSVQKNIDLLNRN